MRWPVFSMIGSYEISESGSKKCCWVLLLAAYVISRGFSMLRSWSFHPTDVTKLRCAWIATEVATGSPNRCYEPLLCFSVTVRLLLSL